MKSMIGPISDSQPETTEPTRKVKATAMVAGIVSSGALLALSANGAVRLSGPYQVVYLADFSKKLEFVLRYQSLGLLVIAVNTVLVMVNRAMAVPEERVQRWNRPLQNSIEQFAMSSMVQMVMTANCSAEAVLLYCPLLAVTFAIGRIAFLALFPKYSSFGFGVSFAPTLVAIGWQAFIGIAFLFN